MNNKIIEKIDLELKEILVDGLSAAADLYKDFKLQAPFKATHNCYAAARWDSINESLSSSFQNKGIPCTLLKTGFWNLLLFCNKDRNVLLSAMRKDRFLNICSNPGQNAPKYFDSLVSLNDNLKAKASQMTLLDEVYEANDRYNQLENICRCLPKPNASKFNHVILLFDVEYDEFISVKLCVVNNKFEIVEEEDIMQTVFASRVPDEIPNVIDSKQKNTTTQIGFVKLKNSAIDLG